MSEPTDGDFLEVLKKHANFGHAKRNQAFIRQVEMFLNSPGDSHVQAAANLDGEGMSNLVSFYRTLNNESITLQQLREIRLKTTLETMPKDGEIIVVHDMSPLDYTRYKAKTDRRAIGNGKGFGYEYTPCVAIDPKTRNILGVLHDSLNSAAGPDDSRSGGAVHR